MSVLILWILQLVVKTDLGDLSDRPQVILYRNLVLKAWVLSAARRDNRDDIGVSTLLLVDISACLRVLFAYNVRVNGSGLIMDCGHSLDVLVGRLLWTKIHVVSLFLLLAVVDGLLRVCVVCWVVHSV